MPSHHTAIQTSSRSWLPLVIAGILGLAGYFGPWTPHRTAGLVVTGLDLGEYVKFIPQVMAGHIALRREIFYLPLLASSLAAGLLAGRRALPRPGRLLCGLAAILLALALLPPAWSPGRLLQPEFRLQTLAISMCLAGVACSPLTRYLPERCVLALIAPLAIVASVAPAWDYLQVRPAIAALYRQSLPLGWGFWLGTCGFLCLAVLAVAGILARRSVAGRKHGSV